MSRRSTKFESESALDEHLRAIALRDGPGATLFLAIFVAVLWPSDLLVFRGDGLRGAVGAIACMRGAVIVVSLAAWALLRSPLGARRPMAVLGGFGVLIMFAVGCGLGALGGADRPWIHLAHPALFLSVPAPARLRARATLVAGLAAALLCGFLAPYPAHLGEPMAGVAVSFVCSTALLALAVGHLSFRILCQSFYQSRALERASHEVAELNATLESRVRAQTSDLRRLTDHLERARESERTRVARELHDELGQELTALDLALTLAQKRYARDPGCIRNNLTELESLVARTRVTTRQLVTELRPRLLDELGLQPAIEWLLRNTEQRSGVRCRLAAAELASLPPEICTVAFRIVQEALTNVARHAQAQHAEVTLAVREGRLELTVSDDGVGLPASPAPAGFGLIGIRERVTTLEGRLALEPRPGGGTTLAVSLPIVPEVRAEEAIP